MKKLISRRNFLKVCALAGSAAALSACGGGKSTGSSNSAAAAVDTTGAVTFPLSEKVTFTGMTSFPVGSESEPNNRTIFKLSLIHISPLLQGWAWQGWHHAGWW